MINMTFCSALLFWVSFVLVLTLLRVWGLFGFVLVFVLYFFSPCLLLFVCWLFFLLLFYCFFFPGEPGEAHGYSIISGSGCFLPTEASSKLQWFELPTIPSLANLLHKLRIITIFFYYWSCSLFLHCINKSILRFLNINDQISSMKSLKLCNSFI